MEKKDKIKILVLFGIVLVLALLADVTGGSLDAEGRIQRAPIGEEEENLNLLVQLDGTDKEYTYEIKVEPILATREQAEQFFDAAIAEIDRDFQEVGKQVPIKTEYQDGVVEAEWSFEPSGLVRADGSLVTEKGNGESNLIHANVVLSCDNYETIYSFPFEVVQEPLTEEEELLQTLDAWVSEQMLKEGQEIIELPKELGGVSLHWSEQRENLFGKILILEGIAFLLLIIMQRKKKTKEEQKRCQILEREYMGLVSQLNILVGAGMTIRQAWIKIANRYWDKKQQGQIETNPVYEGVLRMSRRLSEGEGERMAYQHFGEEMQLMCYQKLIRCLISNLEKGSKGIGDLLEQESRLSYEQRIMQAKKLGEEASTKLLFPLMLMMLVVMAVVIIPAILGFSVR